MNIQQNGDLMQKKYNGYTNYETWNVVLWINNDELLHSTIKNVWANNFTQAVNTYEKWLLEFEMHERKTPDGVAWSSKKINYKEINEHINEMFRNHE